MWTYARPRLTAGGVVCERLTDRLVTGRHDLLWMDMRDGVTGLCELKAPDSEGGRLGLRPDQPPFIWSWWRKGGYSSILVRWPDDLWELYIPGPRPAWIDAIKAKRADLPDPDYAWGGWPGAARLLQALRTTKGPAPSADALSRLAGPV